MKFIWLFHKILIYLHCDSEIPSISDGFFKNKTCVRTHKIDLSQI